jgi:hypothetical protein
MAKTIGDNAILFKPLLAAGIIIFGFGVTCVIIGSRFLSVEEGGDGFVIIGIRFIVGGIVSIFLGFLAKYFPLIKFLIRKFAYKRKSKGEKYSDWYRP